MNQQGIEQEWMDKYSLETGLLKDSLSNECYNWALDSSSTERIEELKREKARQVLLKCYDNMVNIFKKYIDMPEIYYKFVSLWTISTYFQDNFNTFPFLFFNAMRGSGKTRILKLISSLGAKGDGSVQNNLTEAVLFRIPKGTTTCIDEVEQIGAKEKQTLRELLNSAYKKGMKVKRMKKIKISGQETQVAEVFEPYFPIAMANINGVEEVLGDRSIVLILEKSDNPSKTKLIEDFDTNVLINELKRTLNQVSVVSVVSLRKKRYIERWNDYISNTYNNNDITTLTTLTTLTTQTTLEDLEMEELFRKIDKLGIHGRNLELLLPLLIVAKEISPEVFEDCLKISAEIVQKKKEDEYADSKDVSLIEFITTKEHEGLNHLNMKQLTSEFRIYLGETDDDDRWLNEKWLGRALKRLNLILDKRRVATGRLVLLNFVKAKEKLKIFRKDDKNEAKDVK